MSRSYDRSVGAIDVKCTAGVGAPEQFVWRDRLYRVEHVLQQWDRCGVWWKDISAAPTGRDVQMWRVEASAGRCEAQGVYDLSFDPAAGRWFLLRTFD